MSSKRVRYLLEKIAHGSLWDICIVPAHKHADFKANFTQQLLYFRFLVIRFRFSYMVILKVYP